MEARRDCLRERHGFSLRSNSTHLPRVSQTARSGRFSFSLIVLPIVAFVTAMMLLFFYLGSRLQFVLFAIVSEKREMVTPLWARYGPRTWRWIGLKLILSFAVCAVFGVPLAYRFTSLIQNLTIQPGQPPSPAIFANILLLYLLILTPIFFLMLCSSLLSDFVLPPSRWKTQPSSTPQAASFSSSSSSRCRYWLIPSSRSCSPSQEPWSCR